MGKQKSLGKVELELLQAVDQLQPVSVRDLAEHLADSTGQARTTVLTILERLRRKGFLSRKKIKGVNHYYPRVAITDVLPRVVSDFVRDMLGGAVSPVVSYLQDKQLKPDELAKLKLLVEELESKQATSRKERES